MKSHIYKITNTINNKVYIGKTSYTNPLKRWKEHLRDYKKEYESNRPLYKAFQKYGPSAFTFEVIAHTDNPEEDEKLYIIKFKSFKDGYNATRGGDGRSYIDYDKVVEYYKANHPSISALATHFNINVTTATKILKLTSTSIQPRLDLLYKPVLQKTKQGILIQEFESINHAAKALGNISYNSNIGRCCRGERKSANGFVWEYK